MMHPAVDGVFLLSVYLDEAGGRVASLLEMFLPVLLLDFEGKAGAQDALSEGHTERKRYNWSTFTDLQARS